MPRGKKKVEAFLIILDLGSCHSEYFLKNAKLCITRMVQRRIFTKSHDEIGLLLVGSEKTQNPLDYPHVSIEFPLDLPSWKMLSFINELRVEGSDTKSDWLQGIVVGMQILKDQLCSKEFTKTTFVLVTDCSSDIEDDDGRVKIIIENLCSMEISTVVLGLPEESEDGPETKNSRKLLNNIIQNVSSDGAFDFDLAVYYLNSLQNKQVTPTPWKVMLNIGPNIKIPVDGFRRISEDQFPTWDKVIEGDTTARPCQESAYFVKLNEEDTTDMSEPVEPSDVLCSYMFGDTIVPLTMDDEEAMEYHTHEKCLSVICFTAAHNVPQHILTGNGVLYFTIQRGRDEAGVAFSALVQAMSDMNNVAIVRRIYNKGNAPYVGVLYPKYESGFEFLVYVELPFAEDVRDDVLFRPLKQEIEALSSSQLNAVDDLIDSMDLMYASEDQTEAFNPEEVINVGHHHRYMCISHRVLNPEAKELPSFQETKEITTPFVNSMDLQSCVRKLKSLFELKKIEPKKSKNETSGLAQLLPAKNEPDKDFNQPSTSANESLGFKSLPDIKLFIGTTNPEGDFLNLLNKGADFLTVFDLMQKAIETLVAHSFDVTEYEKPLGALKTLRKKCIQLNVPVYNKWMMQFKDWLKMSSKITFWNMIVSDKLGLISCNESDKSTVSTQEVEDFLVIDEQDTVKHEDSPDIYDGLLDDL